VWQSLTRTYNIIIINIIIIIIIIIFICLKEQ